MSTSGEEPRTASTEGLLSRLDIIETSASKLSEELLSVTRLLEKRTTEAARATLAHTSATTEAAKLASQSVKELDNRMRVFLDQTGTLHSQLQVIVALASAASALRKELYKLELQTEKLLKARNGLERSDAPRKASTASKAEATELLETKRAQEETLTERVASFETQYIDTSVPLSQMDDSLQDNPSSEPT